MTENKILVENKEGLQSYKVGSGSGFKSWHIYIFIYNIHVYNIMYICIYNVYIYINICNMYRQKKLWFYMVGSGFFSLVPKLCLWVRSGKRIRYNPNEDYCPDLLIEITSPSFYGALEFTLRGYPFLHVQARLEISLVIGKDDII